MLKILIHPSCKWVAHGASHPHHSHSCFDSLPEHSHKQDNIGPRTRKLQHVHYELAPGLRRMGFTTEDAQGRRASVLSAMTRCQSLQSALFSRIRTIRDP